MGKMCQEMLPGRCREERHSPVGWLVLIVNVVGFERDWWGISLWVAERFPRRSNWKGKASVMMDCNIPWAETLQSKRGACTWGWSWGGRDWLWPCFNHHKLCHAFLAIMDWSHLDRETKQTFLLMSYSYRVFCVIYAKMTNRPCQQYILKLSLSPRMPLTNWVTIELHRASVSPSIKMVIVILAL